MKDISGLMASVNGYLGWNKARVSCFMQMLFSLFAVKTVNLSEIALAFNGKAEVSSNYRRLQRFFALFKIDFVQIACWIFKLYVPKDQFFYLVIDRTNWYWGKKKINVFMLGIAHEGMAIPLFWRLLPKAGSSNFKEQKELLSQFIATFGVNRIKGLLADREFASGKLFKWLNKQHISFYIRIKEGAMVCLRTKKFLTAKKLFNDLQLKTKKVFQMSVWVFGQKVFLAGSRSERGELMIVATNGDPRAAIVVYLRRWEIECLFQALKGRGFRFEETHMTKPERIEKMLAVLAIAFVWAHKMGEWQASKKPIRLKRLKTFLTFQKRPAHSFFRYGFDVLRDAITGLTIHWKLLIKSFLFLDLRPSGRYL